VENQNKSTPHFVWIAAIGVFAFCFLGGIYGYFFSNQSNLNTVPTPIIGNNIPEGTHQTTTLNTSSFSEISQADQTRTKEIITGVMQNTISVTPDIKNELRSIFTKYNATSAEINDFATYGPALVANYQKLFFTDALQAVTSGTPVKSDERLNFETKALSLGVITTDRIKTNDEEMQLIATHQPIKGSDGKQVIFTADNINSTLNNIDSVTARLKSLFE